MAAPNNPNSDNLKKEIESLQESLAETASEVGAIVDAARELAKEAERYAGYLSRAKEIGTDIKNDTYTVSELTSRLGQSYVKTSRVQQLQQQISSRQVFLEKELYSIQKKREEDLSRISEALKTKLKQKEKDRLVEERSVLNSEYEESVKIIERLIKQNSENESVLKGVVNQLDLANSQAQRFENKSRILVNVLKSLSKIPIIGPLLDAERLADSFQKSNKDGFKQLGTQVKNAFSSPIFLGAMAVVAWSKVFDIFKSITKLVLEFDTRVTNISNTLAISRASSKAILLDFYNATSTVQNLKGILDESFITMTNAAKAISDLNEGFGSGVMFSKEMLQTQILLTEQMGLSNEEALGIQKYTYLSGVSAKNTLDIIVKQNRYGLSYRKIISDISNSSSEISTAYKNQPELLAKAAIEASRIGMALEDTKKIAESLLNFETSIDNELKAELLTGQQLNYEKARSLALDGDSVSAAGELVRQLGGISKLTQLNVIQRKAIAESIGLSSEELTKYAQQQQIITSLGAENKKNLEDSYNSLLAMGKTQEANALLDSIRKKENGEMLAQDIARASLNQRFEQSITRIKEIFVDMLAGPITGILEGIGHFLKNLDTIKPILKGLLYLTVGIAGALTGAAIATAIATGGISALIGGIAAVGIAATVTGAMDAYGVGQAVSVQDAAISPEGRITISTPKGKIIPDRQDSIITTTDPQGLLGPRGSDTSKLELKLDRLISVVEKGGNVYIDSTRSGTAYGMAMNSFA